jgi:type IV pilus assembly protein PilC
MLLSVIPKIQHFLVSQGKRLPAITQMLLDVSSTLQAWMPGIALAVLLGLTLLALVRRTPRGRVAMDWVILRLPLVGGVFRMSDTAVFSRGLCTLLDSGVILIEGLRTTEALLANKFLATRLATAREQVLQGGSLAETLRGAREFSPLLCRMIAVGESTGTLGPALTETADYYESLLALTIRRMSILIEPATILVVGGIVGFVYIAFFMALFALTGGVR